MQRAAAATPETSVPASDEALPERQQLLDPLSAPTGSRNQPTVLAFAEERSLPESSYEFAGAGNETKWAFSFQSATLSHTDGVVQLGHEPLRIVTAGYAGIDGNQLQGEGVQLRESESRSLDSGRRVFGQLGRAFGVGAPC